MSMPEREYHRNNAGPTIRYIRAELSSRIKDMRHDERVCRKRGDEKNAEEYRKAANAMENALAELEHFRNEK